MEEQYHELGPSGGHTLKWAPALTTQRLPRPAFLLNEKAQIAIKSSRFTIGSGAECDFICNDPYMSANHFTIYQKGSRYFLKDLGSTNGTRVDGRLVKELELSEKCLIEAGRSRLTFFQEANATNSQHFKLWHGILGESQPMKKLYSEIEKAATSRLPVLIHGETGSGKELVAKALYELAYPKEDGPFLVRNCATFTDNLLSSELFGHKKGAFTGASENHQGAFMAASGGMLFLDEIGELPLTMQPALLRAVEYGEITPLGASMPLKVNVRLITASHRELSQMVAKNLFREDLFYRLSAFPIEVPPLRERGRDILLLADYFLHKFGAAQKHFTKAAQDLLLQHNWPGNIRELANCIQLTICQNRANILDAADICLTKTAPKEEPKPREEAQKGEEKVPLKEEEDNITFINTNSSATITREYFLETLVHCRGNMSLAAKKLNISRSTIYRLKKEYEITADNRRV